MFKIIYKASPTYSKFVNEFWKLLSDLTKLKKYVFTCLRSFLPSCSYFQQLFVSFKLNLVSSLRYLFPNRINLVVFSRNFL